MASSKTADWEFQQPFELCPEEDVWKVIALYLKDPYESNNLLNFSKSSSYIKDIVLKVYPSLYFIEVLEHVAPYLKIEEIRKCREVSRRWNTLFIPYLDHFYDSITEFPEPAFPYVKYEQDGAYFISVNEIDRWTNGMNPALISSAVRRSYCLKPIFPEEINKFIDKSIDHFATWGDHTWNLRFDFFRFNCPYQIAHTISTIDFLRYVQSCLLLVPNLKTLNLDCILSDENQKGQSIHDWLETNPFPPLPLLRHFNIYSFLENMFIWEGLVAAYQSSLESLKIVMIGPCSSFLENSIITLPQLTKLSLHLKASEVSIILRVAERSQWSLKKLDVKVTLGLSHTHTLTMEHKLDFQQLLQNSKSTLEILSIWMTDTLDDSPTQDIFAGVSLPCLKQFKVSIFELNSLDFLAEFSPNLEHLAIRERPGSHFEEFEFERFRLGNGLPLLRITVDILQT